MSIKKKKKDTCPGITKALRRGRILAKKLLKKEGGVMSAEEVAKLLNVPLVEVFNLRAKGLLLAVKVRTFPRNPNFFKDVYPRWQFDKKGKILKGFRNVLEALNCQFSHDDWTKFIFFFSKIEGLKNTPLEELRAGNINKVIRVAKSWHSQ